MTSSPLLNLKDIDPTDFTIWMDDFHKYTAGDWTITTTEDGTGSATEAISDATNGELLLTNAAGDDDLDFLQWASECWKFDSSKRLYFKARMKVSDVDATDFIMGLQVTDTSPLAVSDGIYFQSDDGDANLDFHIAASSTATDRTAIATLADDTYVVLEFYYDGNGTGIHVAVDGSIVTSVPLTNAPSTELTISFGVQNGAAAAKTKTIDYILVAQER